jgi:hypothetical protein
LVFIEISSFLSYGCALLDKLLGGELAMSGLIVALKLQHIQKLLVEIATILDQLGDGAVLRFYPPAGKIDAARKHTPKSLSHLCRLSFLHLRVGFARRGIQDTPSRTVPALSLER